MRLTPEPRWPWDPRGIFWKSRYLEEGSFFGNSSLLVASTYRLVGKSLNHHIAKLLVGTEVLPIRSAHSPGSQVTPAP